MEEQEKLQRLAKIAADKKYMNECLRDKRCAVIEDKRNKTRKYNVMRVKQGKEKKGTARKKKTPWRYQKN